MTTPIDMALAAEIVAAGTASGKMVVTAESCTGGMVAEVLHPIQVIADQVPRQMFTSRARAHLRSYGRSLTAAPLRGLVGGSRLPA